MSTSLYALTLDAQEVDGELAIAFDKAASDDPEEQAEAEQLINDLMQRASTNSQLLQQKANAICHIHEGLLGKARFLRESAAERLAKAAAEEKAAERLLDYLIKCLTALNPGQKSFPLPEYTLSSRQSEAVEIDLDSAGKIPSNLQRHELKLRFQPEACSDFEAIADLVTKTLAQQLRGGLCDLTTASTPDKSAIKAVLKAGTSVPGAKLVKRRSWSVK